MRLTIIIRPFQENMEDTEDASIRFPEIEIIFEGHPVEILQPFSETLDKVGRQPAVFKSVKK